MRRALNMTLFLLAFLTLAVCLQSNAHAQVSSVLSPGSFLKCTTNPTPPVTQTEQTCCILDDGNVYCGDSNNNAVLVGGGAGDITSVFDCLTGACDNLSPTGTQTLDLSGITIGASTGLKLPGGASCSAATGDSFICHNTGNDALHIGDGSTAQRVDDIARLPTTLTAADTTPEVSKWGRIYECLDTTSITDFVDSTESPDPHDEFTEDFQILIHAQAACSLDCTAGNILCNGGQTWTASVGDSALCTFSTTGDHWSCIVSDPDDIGVFNQESAAIAAPSTSTTDWVRMSGDATASAWGSDGTSMLLDIDNDQVADCTYSKSGGDVTQDCNNTNFVAQPGQTNGDIKFNDSAGTECLELDPDTGAVTQGTNCTTLAFDDNMTITGTLDVSGELTGDVRQLSYTGVTETLSGDDCRGGIHFNNDADAITFNLCDGETGGGQFVILYCREAGNITVDVNDASESFEATGLAPSAGEALVLTAVEGDWIAIVSVSATLWRVLDFSGTLAEETP